MKQVVGFDIPNTVRPMLIKTQMRKSLLDSNKLKTPMRLRKVSNVNKFLRDASLNQIRKYLNDPTKNNPNRPRVEKEYVRRLLNHTNMNMIRTAINNYNNYRFLLLKKHGTPNMIMSALNKYKFSRNETKNLMNMWAIRKLNKRRIPNLISQLSGPGPQSAIAARTRRMLNSQLL